MDLSLILEVSDLTVGPVTPGSAPILDGISFRLNTSDIFGIYGESRSEERRVGKECW